LFFIVFLIGLGFQKIATRKLESEKKIVDLQIAAIGKRLNPHFNLNILNSIGSLYETQETTKAQYFLGKYCKLLRDMLLQTNKIAITVKQELEFTKNYLELEKLRLNDKFEFTVEGENDFLSIEIPKTIIHTFCENAVKHGLKHLDKNGKLIIRFLKEPGNLKILIIDNGIGREKARQYSLMSTGQGLNILNQTLDIYYQLKKVKIKYKITDLYNNENEPAGTKVEINIPVI